jgi:hypothetical protein
MAVVPVGLSASPRRDEEYRRIMKKELSFLNLVVLLVVFLFLAQPAYPMAAEAPLIGDQTLQIAETSVNGAATDPASLTATDVEDNLPLTFEVTGGDGVGVFDVDADGNVTVIDSTQLDFETMTVTRSTYG